MKKPITLEESIEEIKSTQKRINNNTPKNKESDEGLDKALNLEADIESGNIDLRNYSNDEIKYIKADLNFIRMYRMLEEMDNLKNAPNLSKKCNQVENQEVALNNQRILSRNNLSNKIKKEIKNPQEEKINSNKKTPRSNKRSL